MYLVIGIVIILFDQFTKHLVRKFIAFNESVDLIDNFLSITYVRNPGAAWGIMADFSWLLTTLPLIVALVIVVFIKKNPKYPSVVKLTLTMIAAGGIGNFIDRIAFGSVTDMISFSFFPPVFNVADIAVTTGCFFLIIYVIIKDLAQKEKK